MNMNSTTSERRDASALMEIADLKSSNQKLRALLDEVGLKMAYFKAEAKRLQSEKLKVTEQLRILREVIKPSNVLQNPHLLKSILNSPIQSISEALQIQNKNLVITSAQAPFFIEYSNKSWNELCGWESDEVQGHTCAILQGSQSDMSICENLMKDIMTTGYAKMRNINYKKNDEPFISTTTVYPIFDVSSCSSTTSAESPIDEGPSCLPVITHFASVMTDCRDIKVEPSEMARMRAADKNRLQKIADEKMKGNGDKKFDRRIQAKKFPALLCISAEYFYAHGEKLRLSNLLRLMVSSKDALVMTDMLGRIVHANKAWSDLTGYHLRDVEGKTCKFLQGELTDSEEVENSNRSLRQNQRTEMTVLNYRRDGSAFKNRVIIVPIKGGLSEAAGVTHFCALLLPDREIPLSVVMEREESDDASSLSTESYTEEDFFYSTGSDNDEGYAPIGDTTKHNNRNHGDGGGDAANQTNTVLSGKRAAREEDLNNNGEFPEFTVNGGGASAHSSEGSSNKRQCSENSGRNEM